MKKLAKLKEWLTIDDAAKFLSISLAEDVERKDVLQLGLDGHLTLSVYFVNHARARFATDMEAKDAPVFVVDDIFGGKGIPRRFEEFESLSAIPAEVKKLVDSRECVIGVAGDEYQAADGSTRVLVTEKAERLRTLSGSWDLTMIGAERLDIEHEVQQLTGGPEVTLNVMAGVVLRSGEQFAILYEQFDRETNKFDHETTKLDIETLKQWAKKAGEKSGPNDLSNWFPAGGLAVVDHVLVVRTERLTALIDGLSGTNEGLGGQESRMSDPRLKVLAALIEHAGINWSEARGQAAELQRFVEKTLYGPVSADVCESIVKAIKDRMPDWD